MLPKSQVRYNISGGLEGNDCFFSRLDAANNRLHIEYFFNLGLDLHGSTPTL
jgi:hypothetical protein